MVILIKEIAIDIMASILLSFLIPNMINILIISLLELKYSKPELFEVVSFQEIVVIEDNSPFLFSSCFFCEKMFPSIGLAISRLSH